MIKLNQELESTYTLLEEIGGGRGGTVFKAYHKRLQKEVVLKKIHSNLINGNIRTETDILKNLKSEYLPQVFDFFVLEGDVYTVMDFIPGKSLRECLKEGQVFNQKQVIKWLDQLCRAVEKLHEQNPPIIHGDIKPGNIMLTPENHICLIDFNVSGAFENADVMGYTPGYAAPEQVSNFQARKARKAAQAAVIQKGQPIADAEETEVDAEAEETAVDIEETEVDAEEITADAEETTVDMVETTADMEEITADMEEPAVDARGRQSVISSLARTQDNAARIPVDVRSDIYSIGATAYHLLTGQRPGADKIIPLGELPFEIEDSLAYLVMKCLEKDPKKRFQTVEKLHKAVLNVHKSSKRYKALQRRQFFIRLLLAGGMMGCALLSFAGYSRMCKEKANQYDILVEKEREAREQGDYEEVISVFEEARKLYPEKGAAYIEVSLSLYEQKLYEAVIDFTLDEIEYNVKEMDAKGDIYYVYGNCCMELENYPEAVRAFETAVFYNNDNPQYYRDYAIALAENGDSVKAGEQLDYAIRYGLGTDGVYYTQGEIAWAEEDLGKAFGAFSECIRLTKDDYRKMRAYLMCSRILERQERTEKRILEEITLLEEAVETLPKEYCNAPLERLAQAYIDMGDLTENAEYDMKAIKTFEMVKSYGWATYGTCQNIAILYQRNHMYQQCLDTLGEMLEQFGENYNTYKRLAFAEIGMQAEIPIEIRSYDRFFEYHDKAMKLYHTQTEKNQTDMEMISLQDIYDDVVQKGWKKE